MENEKIISVAIGEKGIADELINYLSAEGYEPIDVISLYDTGDQHIIANNLYSKRTFIAGILTFFIILLTQDLMLTNYLEVLVGGKEFQSPFERYIYLVPISFVGTILFTSIYLFILFLRSSNLLSWENDTNFTQIHGGEILIKYKHHPELIIKLNSFKLLHDGGVNIS